MPTRLSNTRKHRGHVSAGHGRVGKQYVAPTAIPLRECLRNLQSVVNVGADLAWHNALAMLLLWTDKIYEAGAID
jgi:hypothetical protein